MNCIHLNFVSDKEGRKFLSPILPQDGLNEKTLNVVITDGDSQRIYPVFQQKAGIYEDYSEYMTRHGCACCSLTTALAAFVEKYADLKPNGTISEVERKHFPEEVYTENYGKVMARQMPVSLYGISLILQEEGVSCEYIGDFEDKAAEKQMMEHLYKGKPVIIETSRMRRKGKRIVHFFDKKYAGSYHTMILLGVDEEGQVVFTQQSMFGMVRTVQTCPDCHGTGKIIKDKCTACRGTGYTSSRKKIQVSVPAGIDNGQSIRIREKGEPGTNGGPRGDLLVEVNVARHPIFQRQDMNIFSTAPLTYAQAALGGTVRINTVDGEVEYEVKPGTQTDTRIRLKGKGVPSLRNKNVRGDHYVTLVVQVPTNLNEEAKEALRKFDEACGNRPKENADGSEKKKKSFMDKLKETFED